MTGRVPPGKAAAVATLAAAIAGAAAQQQANADPPVCDPRQLVCTRDHDHDDDND